jgi:hypothetical protein
MRNPFTDENLHVLNILFEKYRKECGQAAARSFKIHLFLYFKSSFLISN